MSDLAETEPSDRAHKGELEALVNPFGAPWSTKGPPNRSIPVATSSMFRLYDQFGGLPPRLKKNASGRLELRMDPDEQHYLLNSNHPFHYDESVSRLTVDMADFRAVKAAFQSRGIHKTFIGYSFVNITEGQFFLGGIQNLKEEWFVHRAGEPVSPDSRILLTETKPIDRHGYLMDTTNAEYGEYVAELIASVMADNDVDAVLLDFMGHMFPVGYYTVREVLPRRFLEFYRKGQIRTLRTIAKAVQARGKMVFYNGIGLDGFNEQSFVQALRMLQACDGVFWEQPFRDELREVPGVDNTAYYTRLRDFFELSQVTGKYVIIKQGTYRFSGDEAAVPGWNARFALTSIEKERRLARYLLAFYLLFTCGERTPLIYTHPVQAFDIFSSEAFFAEWDMDIGTPTGDFVRHAKHVYSRRFTKALVFCNNLTEPFGYRLDSPHRTLDGEIVTRVGVGPKSGEILVAA